MCKYFLPFTAPLISVIISKIFSRFFGSFNDFLLIIKCAVEVNTSSTIFNLFCFRVVPVSVTSMIASTSSGGFASVAPNDK